MIELFIVICSFMWQINCFSFALLGSYSFLSDLKLLQGVDQLEVDKSKFTRYCLSECMKLMSQANM